MKFSPPLIEGRLIKRYKRFLADVCLPDGSEIMVHCPNTGKMTGCAEPGSRVWLLDSRNEKRKYRYTWELVETEPGELACIHSARANKLLAEALAENRLAEFDGYEGVESEVVLSGGRSRIDFCLRYPDQSRADQLCYLEVKCVTLEENGHGYFPDTVSERATRHLKELIVLCKQEYKAALVFVVQNTAVRQVSPARHIDPRYADACFEAVEAGVEFYAYRTEINEEEIRVAEPLPVVF